MKTLMKLVCILVLISIPMALLAAKKDDSRSGDSYYSRPNDRANVSFSGSVTTTDKHGHTMQIEIGGRSQRFRLSNDVRVYSGSRTIDLDELRRGDGVRIEGYRSNGNEFIGLTIYAGSNNYSNDGYYSRDGRRNGQDSIHGRVVKTATIFSRNLRVEDLDWHGRGTRILEVDVQKDAQVLGRGRNISVHEIRTGDVINGQGTWTGSRFIADYLTVNEGYSAFPDNRDYRDNQGYRDSQTLTGIVQDVDYRDMHFTVDNGPDKFTVYAGNARVVRDGNNINFRDIRRGDEVTISGSFNGKRIDADHVDISRDYRYGDGRY